MAKNTLYYGDNLELLRSHDRFPNGFVDLIYLDPPFNSSQDYNVLFKERDGTRSTAPGDPGHLGELLEQHEEMNQQCW
jgi:site-specific DNA-methyltransferase (adenine-specific)